MAKSVQTIMRGSKVKVKVGKTWHPAKIIGFHHEGATAELHRLDDSEHKTIYARVDCLRVIETKSPSRVRGKVSGA